MKTLLRTVKPASKLGKLKLSAIKKAVASVKSKKNGDAPLIFDDEMIALAQSISDKIDGQRK